MCAAARCEVNTRFSCNFTTDSTAAPPGIKGTAAAGGGVKTFTRAGFSPPTQKEEERQISKGEPARRRSVITPERRVSRGAFMNTDRTFVTVFIRFILKYVHYFLYHCEYVTSGVTTD